MFENMGYLYQKSFGSNYATFCTAKGESVEVNKYLLLLYDEFYQNIIGEKIEEQLVFIFDCYSFEELEQLRNRVVLKHFKCKDTCQNTYNDQSSEESINQYYTGTVNIESNSQTVLAEEKVDTIYINVGETFTL